MWKDSFTLDETIKELPMANCWKCGQFLGEKDEWKKMTTTKGDICIPCYNKAKEIDTPRIQAEMDDFLRHKEKP